MNKEIYWINYNLGTPDDSGYYLVKQKDAPPQLAWYERGVNCWFWKEKYNPAKAIQESIHDIEYWAEVTEINFIR